MFLSLPQLHFQYQDSAGNFRLHWGGWHGRVSPEIGFLLARCLPVYFETNEFREYLASAGLDQAQLPLLLELEYPGYVPVIFAPNSDQHLRVALLPQVLAARFKKTWFRVGRGFRSLWPVRPWVWLLRRALAAQMLLLLLIWALHPYRPHWPLYAEGKGMPAPSAKQPLSARQERRNALQKMQQVLAVLHQVPDGSLWQQGHCDFSKGIYRLQAHSLEPQALLQWSQLGGWQVDQSDREPNQGFCVVISRGFMAAVPHLANNQAPLSLAEFTRYYAPSITQFQRAGQKVRLSSHADLPGLTQMAQDFPGTLLSWDFSAQTQLEHMLVFQISGGIANEN